MIISIHSFLWLSNIPLYVHHIIFVRQSASGHSACFHVLSIINSAAVNIGHMVNMKGVQSCPTLCDPMDYTVHGILQARTLEWVAFPFSRGSSQPRDWTQVSRIVGRFFTNWAPREAPIQYIHLLKLEFWLNICLRVGLLDHMAALFLIFKGTSLLFSIVAAQFTFSPTGQKGFLSEKFFSVSTNQMSNILILLRNSSLWILFFFI